jgi:histidine triad (HIT) family protein
MKTNKINVHRNLTLLVSSLLISMFLGACTDLNIHNNHGKNHHLNFQENCSFCAIIAGIDKDAVIIAENDDVMVIEKKPVRSPANCLIIPKKHITNLKAIDAHDMLDAIILSKMGLMAQELAKNRLAAPGDFTVIINNGATSNQTVFHMHMHMKSNQQWKK